MTFPLLAARRCWHAAINPLHATVYFSPEIAKEFAALGITDPVAVNLAHRSAAMGAVEAGVVTATFYNYRHDLVARHLPAVWDTTTPEEALAARLRAADGSLHAAPRRRDHSVARARRGRRPGDARHGGLHPARPHPVRGPRRPPRTAGAAPAPVARHHPAARAPRRRPPRRPAPGGPRPGRGAGQSHRHRQGHDAEVAQGHARLGAGRPGRREPCGCASAACSTPPAS